MYGAQLLTPANASDTAVTVTRTATVRMTGPARRGSGDRTNAPVISRIDIGAMAWKWFTHFVGLSAISPSASAHSTALCSTRRCTGSVPRPPRPLPIATSTSSASVSTTGRRRAQPEVFSRVW